MNIEIYMFMPTKFPTFFMARVHMERFAMEFVQIKNIS
jgi:hypothetical protein